jgi:integrase
MTQKTMKVFGQYGKTVRVWQEDKAVRVQCRALGVTRSFRGVGAKAKAYGFAERLASGMEAKAETRLTLADLWDAYTTSADFTELRPRSRELYTASWKLFLEVVPPQTAADDVTVLTVEAVRRAWETTPRPRAAGGLSINVMRKAIGNVKIAFAWAERVELIHRNRIRAFRFKVAKERRPQSPGEYTAEELQRILATLSFDRLDQRTALAVLTVIGYQGARENAALHLRWEDILWDEDVILWRSEWDKMGNEWDQPLRAATRAILGRLWDAAGQPATGWVFPAKRKDSGSETYTAQSLAKALWTAEKRAGVPHRRNRGAHGFRRGLAGDLVDATGSAQMAMEAIGDRSVKMAETYVMRRRGRKAQAMKALDKGVA